MGELAFQPAHTTLRHCEERCERIRNLYTVEDKVEVNE